MTETDVFDVFYRGQIIDGFTKESASDLLSKQLNVTPEKANTIIAATNCRISRNIPLSKAKEIKNKFTVCGLSLLIIYVDTVLTPDETPEETTEEGATTSTENQTTGSLQPVPAEPQENSEKKKLTPQDIAKVAGVAVIILLLFLLWKYHKLAMLIIILWAGAYIAMKFCLAMSSNRKYTSGMTISQKMKFEIDNATDAGDVLGKIFIFLFAWLITSGVILLGAENT